jgi:hypothetical protein
MRLHPGAERLTQAQPGALLRDGMPRRTPATA